MTKKAQILNNNSQGHVLVIRFSSMGDVAIMVPVIIQLRNNYPLLFITVVSQEKFKPLFENMEGVDFFSADIFGKHQGLKGVFRLFREIRMKRKITFVADLHNVIRSKALLFLFRLAGYKTGFIRKGRDEKKKLTRKENKKLIQLKTTVQRYGEVFIKAGFHIILNNEMDRVRIPVTENVMRLLKNDDRLKLGIAPFAMHQEKMYPLDKMKQVVIALLEKEYEIFLFGGGKEESSLMEKWVLEYPGMVNTINKLNFSEELILISQLDGMISMDSANMHMASLFGVPVVSIWGATHPYTGFYGYGQKPERIVQVDLFCRPCSVFGNKPCYRGDLACMNMIEPQKIIDKAEEMLHPK